MSDLAPRPRSATELVDAAFQIYRRYPGQFIVATALVTVPWLVVRLALGVGVRTAFPEVRELLIAVIGGILTYVLVSGLVTQLASRAYLGGEVNIAEALGVLGRKLPALLVTSVIRVVCYFVGLLVFLVGAFYPLARFFAVNQVIILEDRSVVDAFARSGALSRNIKLHILGTLLLLFVINMAVSIGVGFPLTALGNRVIQQVVMTVVSTIAYPLYSGIGETLLYVDARIRNEGYDVELLAASTPAVDHVAGTAL